ncbi:MAG TPA: hypothetical protein VFQ92_02020 [Blastocatellia bacterium]|nr:hypothetical protein [Blastocatellia bacterium]
MRDDRRQSRKYPEALSGATVLNAEGRQINEDLWESGVYLGTDGFVYYVYAEEKKGQIKTTVLGKRSVGEYLRWVDGLFVPGTLPSESNAVHFLAARRLRELI